MLTELQHFRYWKEELLCSRLVIGLDQLVNELNEFRWELRLGVNLLKDKLEPRLIDVEELIVKEEPIKIESLANQGIDHLVRWAIQDSFKKCVSLDRPLGRLSACIWSDGLVAVDCRHVDCVLFIASYVQSYVSHYVYIDRFTVFPVLNHQWILHPLKVVHVCI